jgi:hypothetical protein
LVGLDRLLLVGDAGRGQQRDAAGDDERQLREARDQAQEQGGSAGHPERELSSEELAEFRSRLLERDLDPVEERRALEPYASRRIYVTGKINEREARIVIRDDGPGFDVATVPDPFAPENLEKENGRGLMLIQSFMDEVAFNEKGNELTMTKWREVLCQVDEDGQPAPDDQDANDEGGSVLE